MGPTVITPPDCRSEANVERAPPLNRTIFPATKLVSTVETRTSPRPSTTTQYVPDYTLGTLTVSVAPPEYVILRKLEYYREGGSEKHVRDFRAMLALWPVPLDRAALAGWLERLDLHDMRVGTARVSLRFSRHAGR